MLLEGTLHTSCYLVHASLFTKRTKLFLLRLKICCISLYTTVVLSRHISLKYYQHLLIEVCNACQCSVPHLVLPLGCDLGLQDLRNAALAFRPPVGSCEHAVTCFSVKEAQHDCLHPDCKGRLRPSCSKGHKLYREHRHGQCSNQSWSAKFTYEAFHWGSDLQATYTVSNLK